MRTPGPCPTGAHRQVTAEQLRARGNALFQEGDHGAALAVYTEALSLSDAASERAVLHRNRAACYLKLVSAGRVRHRGPAGTCPAGWGCSRAVTASLVSCRRSVSGTGGEHQEL